MGNKCIICKEKIEIFDFDLGNAIVAVNPITFRRGNIHCYCYSDACDIAEETPVESAKYLNRYDEYITKGFHEK